MRRSFWMAGAAVLVLAVATTGGWGLGAWTWADRGGPAAADPAVADAQNATGAPGQRAGQPPRTEDLLPPLRWPWWRDSNTQREVGLTPAQVARLDEIVKEREVALAPFVKEWRTQRDELNRMARERQVSIEEFAVQASRVDSLYVKLTESRTVMLYRMSRELSDEQYRKLQEVRDRRASRGGRGVPPGR